MYRSGFTLLLSASLLLSGTARDREMPRPEMRERLNELSRQHSEDYRLKKAEALQFAGLRYLPVREVFEDGRVTELQYIDQQGFPVYHTTFNSEAAFTVNTHKVNPGGELGLDLAGDGFLTGIWDAGVVDTSHQEFKGRLILKDRFADIDDHATHVAGTLAAEGINPEARGMAFAAGIISYDWNNYLSEIAKEASEGLLISNQSFGIKLGWTRDDGEWVWNGATDADEDYRFGFYSEQQSRALDEIAWLAPDLLMVWSAGNSRTGEGDGTKEPNGPWDCIGPEGVSKNVLAVGAVRKIPEGYNSPSDVVMTTFSSWGPSDDGRIKPDLVAPGQGLLSPIPDDLYGTFSGTSMSAPVTAGSLLLLQELYTGISGNPMRSATLKALAIHTAFETGTGKGPDYRYGWGMLNTSAAAEVITRNDSISVFIKELTLEEDEIYEFGITSDGLSAINVTIAWTDPPGSPPPADSINPPDLMLVNDLDIRIRNEAGDTSFPWILDPGNPEEPASAGDNFRDNVEKILIEHPEPRRYTVSVSHKGELEGGSQDFSLILTASVVTGPEIQALYWTGGEGEWHDPLNWSYTSGGPPADTIPGPDINVVFDENSFSSGTQNVLVNENAHCRSFTWLAKEDNGIVFNGADLLLDGDFFVSSLIHDIQGGGYFIFRGSSGLINSGKDGVRAYSFAFDNEHGKWDLMSNISIDRMVLRAGEVDFSGREIRINSFITEGELTKSINLSGSSLYIFDDFDLTGINLDYETDSTLVIADLVTSDDQARFKAESPEISAVLIDSGILTLEGEMSIGRIINGSVLVLKGNNRIDSLFLEAGSELLLEGGTEQILTGFSINSGSEDYVQIGSASDVPARLVVDHYIKLCFDYLEIYNVVAAGEAVYVAGTNSLLSGETSGWNDRLCDEVLFARFDIEYPCADAFSRFIDRSDGEVLSWLWDFGDEDNPDAVSDLQNPYYSYMDIGIYMVSLSIDDAFGDTELRRKVEIVENTIAENEIFVNTVQNLYVSTQTAPNYQWYNDGLPIPGANSRTLEIGDYTGEIRVLLWDQQCNRFSASLVVSAEMLAVPERGLIIYPNPAAEVLYIDFSHACRGTLLIEVVDPAGRTVHSLVTEKTAEEIRISLNTEPYPPGSYFVRIRAGREIITGKFIRTQN